MKKVDSRCYSRMQLNWSPYEQLNLNKTFTIIWLIAGLNHACKDKAHEQRMKLHPDKQLLTLALSSAKQPFSVLLTVRCVTALKHLWKYLSRNSDGWERRTPGSTTARPRTTRGTHSVTPRWWKSVSVRTSESVFPGGESVTSRRETESWLSLKQQSLQQYERPVCYTQAPKSISRPANSAD